MEVLSFSLAPSTRVGVFDEAVLEVGLGDLGLGDLAGPATAGDDRGGGG